MKRIRKARLADINQIKSLVDQYASQDVILNRERDEIAENIRDFYVATDGKKIIGIVALHTYTQDGAEIRTLCIDAKFQGKKIGTKLIKRCLKEAKKLGLKYIFVLTYLDNYFQKFEFKPISMDLLPDKVWRDCKTCPQKDNCQEKAFFKSLVNDFYLN